MKKVVLRIGEKVVVGVTVAVISGTILNGFVYPKLREMQNQNKNKKSTK